MRSEGPPPTRRGYPLGEATSSLQKAVRRGDQDGAAYWAIELHESGFHEYVWHRLHVITSEDVGLAEPMIPAVIEALHAAWVRAGKRKGGGEALLFLTHAALLLARAKKSRLVDHAMIVLDREPGVRDVKDYALDKHTQRGRAMGRGWAHFFEEAGLVADPETGEVGAALPDPYEARARALLEGHQMQFDNEKGDDDD